ncbi:PREDICTED: gasdermin-A [Thamnophis sirtalis]|uniref:Gasdermin-A n=1 Tax=Thamnophis sirtalis TaxID=35019 RepID=A0A6I9YYB5_9SAUR|nr:PREDICTED: gasdermin-A [Thamnophis sirtalis]
MILFLSSFLLLEKNSSSDMSFYNATKSLAKMIDSQGDWVPVPSLIDHNNFRPFCLLQKKKKTSWWQSCPFHKTEYQFHDLLLSGNDTSSLVCNNSDLLTLEVTIDGTLKGDISGITDTEIATNVSISYETSVKLKKIHVPIQDLDSLMKEKKINNEHPFIKQSRKLQRNLYVITASAESVEMTKFEESNKLESSIFHKAHVKLSLKGARDKKKIITIPKGCILAFKAKKLFIEEGTVGISYYSTDKLGTFGKRLEGGGISSYSTDKIGAFDNRKNLRKEVEEEYVPFSLMSSNLRGKFLTSFVVLMKKSEPLEELEELELQLEQVLEDPEQFRRLNMAKPEFKNLMDNLQDVKGAIDTELAEATLYFLQALAELTEVQIMLLVESMEKKIVSQQLNLVGGILDKYFWNEKHNFIVEVQELPEEEWDITEALVKEISEISIQRSECTVTGSVHPSALPSALPALYVALFGIDLLSKESF